MEGSPPLKPLRSPTTTQPRSSSPSPTSLESAEATFFRSSSPPDTELEERMAAVAIHPPIVMGHVEGKHRDPDICAHQCLTEITTILAMMQSCSSQEELKDLLRNLLTGNSILMLIIAALIYIVENVDESKLPKGFVVSIACILTSIISGVSLGKWGQYREYIQSQLDNDNLNDEVKKLKEALERALDAAKSFSESDVFLTD